MVAADDVITHEERRFLRRRSEDLRILRGKERDRKTEVIRRIGYILIACYFIRAFAIFLAHQYAVTEHIFLHLHYPVDALTVITRFGFLFSFAVAYFYFLDVPRVIASVSIAGISVNGLLILLDVEWWCQTMLDYDLLFIGFCGALAILGWADLCTRLDSSTRWVILSFLWRVLL